VSFLTDLCATFGVNSEAAATATTTKAPRLFNVQNEILPESVDGQLGTVITGTTSASPGYCWRTEGPLLAIRGSKTRFAASSWPGPAQRRHIMGFPPFHASSCTQWWWTQAR